MTHIRSSLRFDHPARPLAALALITAPMAFAQAALAQEAPAMSEPHHPASIQPETTLSLSATGKAMREPDIAFISTGVQTEAETAEAAMADNREAMNGVFEALREVGIEERNIQTSNFQLYPRYDYIETDEGPRGRRELAGYVVSNQVTAKITDLDTVGATLDSLVSAGGNTFNGIRFALEDDSAARDEARRQAISDALARAELYAGATGYEVARIVTISEHEMGGGPRPQMAMARMESADAAPTPIAGGEIGYEVQVNVTFELQGQPADQTD